jgi:hypothetical protein
MPVFCRSVLPTDHKEEEQMEDRRNVGKNSCNSGDGTDQRVQSVMFMMMMMMMKYHCFYFIH